MKARHMRKHTKSRSMKKIVSLCLTICIVTSLCIIGGTTVFADEKGVPGVKVVDFNENVDYSLLMLQAAKDGSPFALSMGMIYEEQRNMKIRDGDLPYEESTYFKELSSGEEILKALTTPKKSYSEEDLDLLARLVTQEVGCSWIPDWVQQATASVVINRVNDPRFPNTIRDVIYAPGQYGPAITGSIEQPAFDRVKENCRYVLENGPTCPSNTLGQAGFAQGEIWKSYYDDVLGTTTYFSMF